MDRKFEPVMPGRSSQLPPPPEVTQRAGAGETVVLPISQNTVLRNTYWLLALTMLPTIAGAYVGTQLTFVVGLYKAAPILTPLGMFALMLGGLFVVSLLRNSGWGVLALFGFTFIAGVTLTPILTFAAGLRNGGQLVGIAGAMTAVIFFALAAYATVSKKDFSFLRQFLMVGLILLIVSWLVLLFFPVSTGVIALSAIGVFIFSGFILYDLSRIIHGGETNYIMATLSLFVSLLNLFISLLNLLMIFSGQRD